MSTANPPSQFLRSYLRGAGQVFFMENAITGLFFLAAIFWAGYVEGQPSTAWGGAVGLLVATLTALMIDSDDNAIGQGLFGFNGVLVGVAVPTFLADHPLMWLYLVIGAAASCKSAFFPGEWKCGKLLGKYGIVSEFQTQSFFCPFLFEIYLTIINP